MNTGTRLTLLQSKGCNRYAIKTGSGWVEETISEGQPPIRRELSQRRVAIMLTTLSQIDIDQAGPPSYTPVDPFAEDMPF